MRTFPCQYAYPKFARFGNQYCRLLGKDSQWICPYHECDQLAKCRINPTKEIVGVY